MKFARISLISLPASCRKSLYVLVIQPKDYRLSNTSIRRKGHQRQWTGGSTASCQRHHPKNKHHRQHRQDGSVEVRHRHHRTFKPPLQPLAWPPSQTSTRLPVSAAGRASIDRGVSGFALSCAAPKLLSRRWCDNIGTTNGPRLTAARCNERPFHCINNTLLQGLFRFQCNDVRRIEIPCKISPPPRTFVSRSAAPARPARAPPHWSRSACD